MPRLGRVLETALYSDDLHRASVFYTEVLGATPLHQDDRLVALDSGGGSVLLLFRRGASSEGASLPEGFIPPHDGAGPAHIAFAIEGDDLQAWEARLASAGVAVESRIRWPRGGRSLYFRDPDGHSVELATPGVWEIY